MNRTERKRERNKKRKRLKWSGGFFTYSNLKTNKNSADRTFSFCCSDCRCWVGCLRSMRSKFKPKENSGDLPAEWILPQSDAARDTACVRRARSASTPPGVDTLNLSLSPRWCHPPTLNICALLVSPLQVLGCTSFLSPLPRQRSLNPCLLYAAMYL